MTYQQLEMYKQAAGNLLDGYRLPTPDQLQVASDLFLQIVQDEEWVPKGVQHVSFWLNENDEILYTGIDPVQARMIKVVFGQWIPKGQVQ